MKTTPIVVEKTFNVSIEKVWQAITDKDAMKQWFFDLAAFRPEVGFEFSFQAGADTKQYIHLCKVTEVVPGKKISYSWSYKDHAGYSLVTIELFAEDRHTRLVLMHTCVESFAGNGPDFVASNFMAGWTQIVTVSLKKFLEK